MKLWPTGNPQWLEGTRSSSLGKRRHRRHRRHSHHHHLDVTMKTFLLRDLEDLNYIYEKAMASVVCEKILDVAILRVNRMRESNQWHDGEDGDDGDDDERKRNYGHDFDLKLLVEEQNMDY